MAPVAIDEQVAAILDKHRAADSDDEDALIAELEQDNNAAFSALREQRLDQLHHEIARAKTISATAHATYTEIPDEKQLMHITTTTRLCVVHFMKPDFARCRTMDAALAVLAEKHFDTRFVSIDVEHAPFLVVKLQVQVLPCVLAFVDGVSGDRIIGFEGIGFMPDRFTVRELEARLLRSGVLVRAKMGEEDERRRMLRKEEERLEDEEYDEDEWE